MISPDVLLLVVLSIFYFLIFTHAALPHILTLQSSHRYKVMQMNYFTFACTYIRWKNTSLTKGNRNRTLYS